MKAIVTVLVVLVLLVLAGTTPFSVDETESAVLLRFGNPVRTITTPGLQWKLPWPIDRAVKFDRRLLVFDLPRADEPPRELLTLDKKNIEVATYTCWRISDPLRFLETMRDRAGAEAYLGDVVVSELGELLGRHDLQALISVEPEDLRLAEIADEVRATCGAAAAQECGVEIVDFRIKRINLPEQNRESVFARMRAERKQIATRYRSEGAREASAIRAEAVQQRMEILADATRQSLEIQGRAEAEAARIYNEAYGQDPEFYEFQRTLQSYEKTLTDKTTLFLPEDMEYLKALSDPHGKTRR